MALSLPLCAVTAFMLQWVPPYDKSRIATYKEGGACWVRIRIISVRLVLHGYLEILAISELCGNSLPTNNVESVIGKEQAINKRKTLNGYCISNLLRVHRNFPFPRL
ncbi:hypothetical protein EDB82DRAFT_22080 [Fusarium venenatum]|uniref:uncharacterized protein n=1 Tax=Fusarium venenatum TaxID=56646 RepID=UPI001D8769C0|nr:hypothetical protein EDB82DRAFT_22080 [Fusarium venenatum]